MENENNVVEMNKETVTPKQEQKQPTMQELMEGMNHEFSLIRIRSGAIALKKEKMEVLKYILDSDVSISDEDKISMKDEISNLAISILKIAT